MGSQTATNSRVLTGSNHPNSRLGEGSEFVRMEAFAALMMLGVRVREVKRLEEQAIYLPGRRILFIDADLSVTERTELADLYLSEALKA